MKKIILLTCLLLLSATAPAFSKVNAVATLPFIGSIAEELGKDKINLIVLVKPTQDPHYVEAKPSMILAAHGADILLYNGLDLEIGYLPLLIESSRNPKIQPGRAGNLDCSRFVSPMEKALSVDRSMGDVHPLGNPHYQFSPKNILRVAEGIAGALSEVDPANAGFYKENLAVFKEKLSAKQGRWASKKLKGKKFIAYHKMFEYLAAEFGFEITGYVEPKPGIPASAGHIENLIEAIGRAKPDGILTTPYQSGKDVEFLSGKTSAKIIRLPSDVGSLTGTNDWLSFMDYVLSALE